MGAWLAAGLLVGLLGGARAEEAPTSDVWLISTREVPCSSAGSTSADFRYWHLEAENAWVASSLDAMRGAEDPAVPTCVMIHGNRANRCDAVQMGSAVAELLRQHAERPFRFVIWSWSADRIRGRNRSDVAVKAYRSDVQAYYLARWMASQNADTPVSLVGYSLGARVITGALHLLGGGELAGRVLPEQDVARVRSPVRAVLVAAALDEHCLLPTHRNGRALGQVERILITQNGSDPVLRLFPWVEGRGGPNALGFSGPANAACLGADRGKIEVVPVACEVGRNHDWCVYFQAPGLSRRLPDYAAVDLPEE